jgi:integrase
MRAKTGDRSRKIDRTRELAYVVLKAAFRKVNPELLEDVDRPKTKKPRIHPWNAEQATRFLAYLDASLNPLRGLLRLALTSGARKGEIIALSPDDVDLSAGHVSIDKTWNERRREVGPPKSKSSYRNIKIPGRTVRALQEYRAELSQVRARSRFFFVNESGREIEPRNLTKAMKKVMRKAGVPVIRFHDLRHTFATLGLRAGISPKVIQEMLGHASVKITLDLYSHVLPGMQESAAEKIDAVLQDREDPDLVRRLGSGLGSGSSQSGSGCWTRTNDPLINS